MSNETVAPLYAKRLRAQLLTVYARVDLVVLPDGEQYKDWRTLNRIYDELMARRAERSTALIAPWDLDSLSPPSHSSRWWW